MQKNKLIHTSKEGARLRAERAKEISAHLITAYKLFIPIFLSFNGRIIGKKLLTAMKESIKANNLPLEVQIDARYNTSEYIPLFIYPEGSGRAQIIRMHTPRENKQLNFELTIEEVNIHIVNIPSQVARYIDAYENYDKYINAVYELEKAIDKYNDSYNNLICYSHTL